MAQKNAATQGFFRAGEVCRRLGISPTSLRNRVKDGSIPFEMRGTQRLYPVEAIVSLERAEKGRRSGGDEQGKQDARALELLADGATDAEVIRELRMPLERVAALRRATRLEGSKETSSFDATKGYHDRLAVLAQRRAAREGRTR